MKSIALVLSVIFFGAFHALVAPTVSAKPAPAPPELTAKSYILIDAATGTVLAEHNADQRLPPASLTKMMTAYVVQDELVSGNIKASDLVRISKKAWRMRGSLMFIEAGERVSVENLLKGVIVVSGNDASVALAEFVAGSESGFTDLMNATGKELGLENTNFRNASGWPEDEHYSSARDMAILSRHIIQDHPDYYPLYNQKELQYGVDKHKGTPLKPQANRNSLLWSHPGVDGLKTGYTEQAGYCLAASAQKDERRLIAVVLGTASEKQRAIETKNLITYGFRSFENVKIRKGSKVLGHVRVWQGTTNKVPVELDEELIVTVLQGETKKITISKKLEKELVAPVKVGQKVGTLSVYLDNEIIASRDLVAQEEVKQGNLAKRLWDDAARFVDELFRRERIIHPLTF